MRRVTELGFSSIKRIFSDLVETVSFIFNFILIVIVVGGKLNN